MSIHFFFLFRSFGYPSKPHSQSAADLSVGGHPPGHPPYHHPFHGPYPYVHPAPIPPMHPYSHSMAHLNCAQCLSSSSWSNLMSPHPSPYFHPMPWGSAHNTMTRPPHAGQHLKQHSHGDLASYPGKWQFFFKDVSLILLAIEKSPKYSLI